MFGPIIGSILAPLIGGFISEDYSWRWVFMLSVPPAILCIFSIFIFIRIPELKTERKQLDWFGFISLSICVTALQLLLDRGQLLDWFDSPIIIFETILAATTFYLFVSHICTTKNPFLNPRLLKDRNYAVGILLGFTFGMLYFTTFVLQPTMLQGLRGYPDSLIGLIQATRGIGLLAGALFLLIFLKNIDPRLNIVLGFLIQVATGIGMSQFDINMTVELVTWYTILQGFGLGLIWSPLMVLALATLNARYIPEGASVFHLMRNIGSSVHIAATATFVVRSSKENYSLLIEALNPFNETYNFGTITGNWSMSGATNLATISEEISRQATLVGYINAYYIYALTALAAIPLAFLAKRPK
jgi:DHA2 family multidrug resistance protein